MWHCGAFAHAVAYIRLKVEQICQNLCELSFDPNILLPVHCTLNWLLYGAAHVTQQVFHLPLCLGTLSRAITFLQCDGIKISTYPLTIKTPECLHLPGLQVMLIIKMQKALRNSNFPSQQLIHSMSIPQSSLTFYTWVARMATLIEKVHDAPALALSPPMYWLQDTLPLSSPHRQ